MGGDNGLEDRRVADLWGNVAPMASCGVQVVTRLTAYSRSKNHSRRRGTCPVCGFRQNVLKDGVTMARHKVYTGWEGRFCGGSGRLKKFVGSGFADGQVLLASELMGK